MFMNQEKICFILLFLLTACSVNNSAFSRVKKSFDFSSIHSYSTFERNSVFSDFQNISDSTRNSIEIAIEQAFDAKGLLYKNPNNADVVIGYYLITENSNELVEYNKGMKYCRVCLKWSVDYGNNPEWLIVPGSLVLDIVSMENNRSIWRSVYPLKITEKDNSNDIQLKTNSALNIMLKQFPNNESLIVSQASKHAFINLPKLSVFN